MTMTKIQHIMKEKIVTRANVLGDDEIIYRSEWLGYLPFGLYHWIECHGENVSRKFPSDWSHDDIVALEKIGVL